MVGRRDTPVPFTPWLRHGLATSRCHTARLFVLLQRYQLSVPPSSTPMQEGELREALALYQENISAVQAGLAAEPHNAELQQVTPGRLGERASGCGALLPYA